MQDDMIKPLKHVDVGSVDEAIGLLVKHGEDASLIAGNTDEINWLKNRMRAPKVLVDLKPLGDLSGVQERSDGGVTIGALTKVSDVAGNDLLSKHFGVVSEATGKVATPQIRNQGTIGGNLSQDSRCWYYRSGFDCYRAGGHTCYAITGENRDHSVTDYSRCVTAHPSDGAVALMAVDASVVVKGPRGKRRENLENFFVGPQENITVMNDLAHAEVLTHVEVPPTWRDADFYFEKVRDRESWDFPIVNIAAALKQSGGRVRDVRLVANGVAPTPKRLTAAEKAIRGKRPTASNAEAAGKASLPNAAPLEHNGFKVPLTANLVSRAIQNAG
ncbi:MAG: xanthine dehydrogenase family protein subunit M [Salinigranum sp.]